MKCPKCGYLGFDSGDRCRNCGYDFSLVTRADEHDGGHAARVSPPALPGGPPSRDPRLARGSRYRPASPPPAGADRPLTGLAEGTPVDLPLFRGENPVLPPPRAPLSVRRATPTPGRIRPRTPTPQPEEIPLLGTDADAEAPPRQAGTPVREEAVASAEWLTATAGQRAAAAAIDVGLLTLIDLVVLHFTLTLCGLTFGDLQVLPAAPMAAFLMVLNGGYVILFTGTLGQTFGKMAASIEVVSDGRDRMDLRRAALRAAATVVSLLPAGLGWLAGLVGDGRGLHDRLAGTRVVRVAGS